MPKMTEKSYVKKNKSKKKSGRSGNLAVDVENQEKFEAKVDQLPTEVS